MGTLQEEKDRAFSLIKGLDGLDHSQRAKAEDLVRRAQDFGRISQVLRTARRIAARNTVQMAK